jgi:hypothetical protein
MIAELDQWDADVAIRFYQMIKGAPDSSSLARKKFEAKAHKLFWSITEPRSFTNYSFDDRSTTTTTTNIEFSNIHTATSWPPSVSQ